MLWVDRMYGMYRFGRLGTVQDAVSSFLPAYLAVMAGRLRRRPAGYSNRGGTVLDSVRSVSKTILSSSVCGLVGSKPGGGHTFLNIHCCT